MRRILAILFTLAPLVAGAVAALSVRRDLRMLCMAVAATLVARVVIAATPQLRTGAGASIGFVLATITAAAVAVGFGARAVFGVGAVAVVLAGCAVVGAVLGQRPRRAET
ncbi:MAG: hypothetical protein ACJ79K_06340 [Gemmatimonadaceae bacterium]